MGVFFQDPNEDASAIQRILETGLVDWNERFSKNEGVHLSVNERGAEIASAIGGKILADYFPNEGSDSYKRVAALLVTMSLHPFIIGRQATASGLYLDVLHGDKLRYFGIINLVDSIGMFFAVLDQENSGGNMVRMNDWPGFSREDSRTDLIYLLYSYSKSDVLEFRNQVLSYEPLALYQAILSVSMTLKSIYPV